MSQYTGEESHGKWWLHCNGTLQRTPSDITTTSKFNGKGSHVIKVWIVRCELDWYRMMKEYDSLRSELIPPIVA